VTFVTFGDGLSISSNMSPWWLWPCEGYCCAGMYTGGPYTGGYWHGCGYVSGGGNNSHPFCVVVVCSVSGGVLSCCFGFAGGLLASISCLFTMSAWLGGAWSLVNCMYNCCCDKVYSSELFGRCTLSTARGGLLNWLLNPLAIASVSHGGSGSKSNAVQYHLLACSGSPGCTDGIISCFCPSLFCTTNFLGLG